MSVLPERERVARRDPDLLLDQVDAGHHLRDRMLHLDAGVHLDEVELAILQQELDRAGVLVLHRAGGGQGRLGHLLAQLRGVSAVEGDSSTSFWCLRWMEHSRSPRCTTLPLGVTQDLELDVPRRLEVLLDVDVRGP